jgi:hypothetical protein
LLEKSVDHGAAVVAEGGRRERRRLEAVWHVQLETFPHQLEMKHVTFKHIHEEKMIKKIRYHRKNCKVNNLSMKNVV